MRGGPARVRRLLDELGHRPDRRRGQSFLVDMGVLDRQLRASRLTRGDVVLEVGAGLGVLTWELAARALRVVTYETEPVLVDYLREDLPDNVDLRHGDALEEEWPPFDKMVANVPYAISSPLLFKLLGSDYAMAVLLVQREFADRLVARPRTKAYGRLTVSAARLADMELLEVVPPTAFHPRPRVESALVRIVPRRAFPVADERMFEDMLRVVFGQRRKMLRSSLRDARELLTPRLGRGEWTGFLDALERGDRRPEELSPEELGKLSDAISGLRS